MREKPLRVVRRVGRPVRKALNGLKAILDEHLGRDAQRQVDSIMCRPAISGDAVAAKLDCVYAMRPELHEAFAEGPQSDAFWWWANIHGIFEHDELQFSLPPHPADPAGSLFQLREDLPKLRLGGADVCFRFAVQQNNWQPLLTEWQREPSTTFFATAPGLFHLRVEAASGSGYHMAAPVVADADLIVEASVSAS